MVPNPSGLGTPGSLYLGRLETFKKARLAHKRPLLIGHDHVTIVTLSLTFVPGPSEINNVDSDAYTSVPFKRLFSILPSK